MPIAPNRTCRKYGCRNYQAANGYCADHQALAARVDNRPIASERGYDANWSKFRKAYLRANPVCNRCHRAAHVVHHKRPLDKGGAKWDYANLESLCRDCHEREHGRKR